MSTPNTRINSEDHGAKLILAIALMLSYTVIVYATRVQIKWPWNSDTFKAEDHFLLGAIALSVAYTTLIAIAVVHGLGRHVHDLSNEEVHFVLESVLSSVILARITEALALLSLASFIRKMSPAQLQQRLVFGMFTIIAMWIIAGIVIGAIDIHNRSVSRTASIVIGAVLAAVLALLFTVMMIMIWTTQMRLQRQVSATIWLLVLPGVAAFVVARIAVSPDISVSGDFTFDSILSSVWLTIEIHMCIITAAYVSFMRFARNATTGFMGQMLPPESSAYASAYAKGYPQDPRSLPSSERDACVRAASDGDDSQRGIIRIQKTVDVDSEHVH